MSRFPGYYNSNGNPLPHARPLIVHLGAGVYTDGDRRWAYKPDGETRSYFPRTERLDKIPYPCPDSGQEPLDETSQEIRGRLFADVPECPWLSTNPQIALYTAALRHSWLQEREECVRMLLSRWVSELEPSLFIVKDLDAIGGERLLGVGYGPAGQPAIYVEDL